MVVMADIPLCNIVKLIYNKLKYFTVDAILSSFQTIINWSEDYVAYLSAFSKAIRVISSQIVSACFSFCSLFFLLPPPPPPTPFPSFLFSFFYFFYFNLAFFLSFFVLHILLLCFCFVLFCFGGKVRRGEGGGGGGGGRFWPHSLHACLMTLGKFSYCNGSVRTYS